MELEDIANISQIMKTAVIVIGGGAILTYGYLFYRIVKEKNLIRQESEEFTRTQEALGLANQFSRKPTWAELQHYIKQEYPADKVQLEQLQSAPENYQEGIFHVEKKGRRGDFSTHLTRRTQGLVELIEEGNRGYEAAASFVKDKSKPVSKLHMRTNGNSGVAEFPKVLSQEEKEAILNHKISYEEKYSCHDEGEFLGLHQSWDYTLEVLDGSQKGLKLKEDITV